MAAFDAGGTRLSITDNKFVGCYCNFSSVQTPGRQLRFANIQASAFADNEIVELLEPAGSENRAGTTEDSDDNVDDVDGPLDAGEFEDYVEKIVTKLQDREHIPADDEIWVGVRQDFIDFHFRNRREARADMVAYFDRKYGHYKGRASTTGNLHGEDQSELENSLPGRKFKSA